MKKTVSILILLILLSIFPGCERKGDPPILPPSETMLIDFGNFISATKSSSVTEFSKGLKDIPNLNWSVAASIAGVWNTLIAVNLAIPIAAFQKAVNTKPVYLDNKKWQWKYSVDVLAATYIARLTGQITSSEVKWEMYITREGVGGFAEFMWFEGSSATDGKSGYWILYKSHQEQVPFLRIDWEITDTKVGFVKYTYIKEDSPLKNSYIEYGLTTGNLDAFYNVYLFEEESLNRFVNVNIEWSTTGHFGRIKAPDFFGDSNWHCWDENGNDTECLQ